MTKRAFPERTHSLFPHTVTAHGPLGNGKGSWRMRRYKSVTARFYCQVSFYGLREVTC